MLFALHWEPLVEISVTFYHVEELGPDLFPAPRLEERLAVAYDDQAHASAREKDV